MGAFKGPSVCRLAAVGWCAHGRPSSGGSPTRSRRPRLRGACNLPVLATRGSRGRGAAAPGTHLPGGRSGGASRCRLTRPPGLLRWTAARQGLQGVLEPGRRPSPGPGFPSQWPAPGPGCLGQEQQAGGQPGRGGEDGALGPQRPPRTDLSTRRPAACWDVSLLPVSSLLIFLWTQETVAAGAAPSLARAQRLLLTGCNPREKVRGPRPAPSPPAGSARPPVAAGSPNCASRAGCALGSDPALPFRANVLKGEKSQFSKTQGDSGAGGARRGGPQGRPAGAAASGRPAGLARAVPVRLPRRAQAVLCWPPLRHLPPSGPSPSRGARGWVARVSEDASGPSDRPRWSLLSPGLGTEPPRGRLSGRAHETSGSQGPAGGRGACGRRGWPRLPGSQA